MKTKFLLVTIFLLTISFASFAQIKISTKKVYYKRPKTVEMEHKRSFYIVYPKISGANATKIESILSYEKNFDFKLKEQISGEDFWLNSCDFVLNYNKNNILGIELYMEGSGAYPSTSVKHIVVNTKNGTQIKPIDVFTNLNGLAALVKKAQKAEINRETERLKKEEPDFDASEYFNNADYNVKNVSDFAISEKGLVFHYDYGFPHVVLALQPEGNYFFNWKQLKPYIKSNGIFAQFVK